MARTFGAPLEETETSDLPLPPGDVALYIAPGMQTVTFAELLQSAGIMRDQMDWVQEVESHIMDLQRQIDELRSGAPVQPAPLAEAAPETPPPEAPITRPSTPPPQRPPYRRR